MKLYTKKIRFGDMYYKGYIGTKEYSPEDNCYFGKIKNITDTIIYESDSRDGLFQEFLKTVDEYEKVKKGV